MAPAILYSNEAVRAKPCSLWFHLALQVMLPELEGRASKPGMAADTTPADLAASRSGDPGNLQMVLIRGCPEGPRSSKEVQIQIKLIPCNT